MERSRTAFAPVILKTSSSSFKGLFPNAAAYDRPDYWACLRPMTPDGPPIMGASPFKNLWLNTGHGHIGWTMSHGSARIVADQIAGRTPEIPMEGLTD